VEEEIKGNGTFEDISVVTCHDRSYNRLQVVVSHNQCFKKN
jgi:hypothetical protein